MTVVVVTPTFFPYQFLFTFVFVLSFSPCSSALLPLPLVFIIGWLFLLRPLRFFSASLSYGPKNPRCAELVDGTCVRECPEMLPATDPDALDPPVGRDRQRSLMSLSSKS